MHSPNLHTASMRHLIKFRNFLKKRPFLLLRLCDVLKVLDLPNFLKFGTDIHHNTTFPTVNSKLAFRIHAQGTFYLS